MPKRKTHQEGHFSRPGATASRGCVPKLCCLITNHFMLRKLIFQPEGPEAASHWRPASLAAGEPARGNKPRLTPALQTQLHGQPGTQGGGITLPGVTAATPGTYEVPPRAPEQCFGSLGQHRLLPRWLLLLLVPSCTVKGEPRGEFPPGEARSRRLQQIAGSSRSRGSWHRMARAAQIHPASGGGRPAGCCAGPAAEHGVGSQGFEPFTGGRAPKTSLPARPRVAADVNEREKYVMET